MNRFVWIALVVGGVLLAASAFIGQGVECATTCVSSMLPDDPQRVARLIIGGLIAVAGVALAIGRRTKLR
jgi:TRAP-type C4-dicarboxylate transport system permease small subunit